MNTIVEGIRTKPDLNEEVEGVHLAVLRLLEQQPSLSQREVSRMLGLSLGKTNYLLRALLDKGSIKMRNFKRSDNKLAYAYLLTPSGMRHKLDLTRRFLVRKENEFAMLERTIGALRTELGKHE
jgi:EPS-associated MarR family transcriptional regulator